MKPVIAHVITGLRTGGAERVLAQLVERHERSEFQPVVFCLTDAGPVADRIRRAGIPVHDLGMRRGIPHPLVVARLARGLRQERAALVQTWLYHADLVGGLAARLARVPVAWNIRRSSLDPAITPRSHLLVTSACGRLSRTVPVRIICCAESAREVHVARGYDEKKMLVIPNGFDIETYRPNPTARSQVRAELGLADDDIAIGILGRFVPQKNHRMFVDVAAGIAADRPHLRFVMAGPNLDEHNCELTGWIEEAGLRDRFRLLGLRSDVPDLLAGLDVMTLTSLTEGFPNVIGEAMAVGVPCVATDVGDTHLLIGETGGVAPSGDVPAFVRALAAMVDQPLADRAAAGQCARCRIESEFTIDVMVDRYEDAWRAMLSGSAP
jgi:glycosyltransferase involved in cell wall biosynthesis